MNECPKLRRGQEAGNVHIWVGCGRPCAEAEWSAPNPEPVIRNPDSYLAINTPRR